jgi:hypothetical protein
VKTARLEMFRTMPGKIPAEDYATVPPDDFGVSYWFWCEGCESYHRFVTKWPKGETGPTWQFNGDMKKPTFTPSYLARGVERCHLYLTDGVIRYLDDCTHKLKGQSVPLPQEAADAG